MKKRFIFLLTVICMAAAVSGCAKDKSKDVSEILQKQIEQQATDKDSKKEQETTAEVKPKEEDVLVRAARMAAGYDYDGAMELIKGAPGYESDKKMADAIAEYETAKAACVEVDPEKVTHVFYHSLIVDNSKAFDGDAKEGGYNQVMTTISEFNKITQQMYESGYVLVRLRDTVVQTTDENGNIHFEKNKIMLPPDKKPYVLSIDDVSYYHYMDGDGFPSKLVIDKNGKPKNEYKKEDGTVEIGDFDVMPLLDTFLEEHPDASYRGAKGLIALTGYNGVLGYRTDTAYKTKENLDKIQKEFLDATPDFNYEKEVEEAKKVAQSLKDNGWEFASHTWGHRKVGDISLDVLIEDTTKWNERVAPIVGDTDTIIFAFGQDIGDWKDYAPDNQKFQYLKDQGFNFFCNVDSSQYWVQIRDNYVRQGRRNLDGYRMYYDMIGQTDKLSDLFDAKSVFDPDRPTPVPPMGS